MISISAVLAVCVVVATGWVALPRQRRLIRSVGLRLTVAAGISVGLWASNEAVFAWHGFDDHALVTWLPASGATVAAFYVILRRATQPGRQVRPTLVAVLVAEPLVVLGLDVVSNGTWFVHVVDTEISFGWVFVAHTAYMVTLTAACISHATLHRAGQSLAVRRHCDGLVAALAAIRISEALRLELSGAIAAAFFLWWLSTRRATASEPLPTSAEAILDDLGAVILVVAPTGLVMEWNAQAEAFGLVLGVPMRLGVQVSALLGCDVEDLGLETRGREGRSRLITVHLSDGRQAQFNLTSSRPSVESSHDPSVPFVLMLRPVRTTVATRAAALGVRRHRRRALMAHLPGQPIQPRPHPDDQDVP